MPPPGHTWEEDGEGGATAVPQLSHSPAEGLLLPPDGGMFEEDGEGAIITVPIGSNNGAGSQEKRTPAPGRQGNMERLLCYTLDALASTSSKSPSPTPRLGETPRLVDTLLNAVMAEKGLISNVRSSPGTPTTPNPTHTPSLHIAATPIPTTPNLSSAVAVTPLAGLRDALHSAVIAKKVSPAQAPLSTITNSNYQYDRDRKVWTMGRMTTRSRRQRSPTIEKTAGNAYDVWLTVLDQKAKTTEHL